MTHEEFNLRLPRLPKGLKESMIGIPANLTQVELAGIMSIAATYASGVSFTHSDGTRMNLGIMTIIVGRFASLKSAVKRVVDVWMQPLKEEDAHAWQRLEQYNRRKKSRKANERLEDEPTDPIRIIPFTVSCSAFLKAQRNAGDKTLYSFTSEIDTVHKTNRAGAWSSKSDLYREGFDGGEWGQLYTSDQSQSGMVNVRYNWCAMGTLGAAKRMFFNKDAIECGLASRLLIATMPDNRYEEMPLFHDEDDSSVMEKRNQAIREATTLLSSCSGHYDTPRLRNAIREWCNGKAKTALQTKNDTLDALRRRAAVIGMRCGVIYYLLSNQVESRDCIDFALLMAEAVLDEQMIYLEQAMEAINADNREMVQRQGRNNVLFDELPNTFSYQTLAALRPEAKRNALRTMVSRWVNEKRVIVITRGSWQKVGTTPTASDASPAAPVIPPQMPSIRGL